MSDLMSAGGSFGMVVLGLGGIGLLVTLALAGLAFAKRRVPLTLLVLFPILTCIVGAVGAWLSANGTLGAIAAQDPDSIVAFTADGLYDALAADYLSRWVGAFLFGAGAWVGGLGAFFAGPEGRMTPVAAAAAALSTLMGAIVVGAYSAWFGIAGGTVLVALILFSGLGVTLASTKRALYEHAQRVAGMRFASAMCMLLAVSYGGRALLMGNRMETFGPTGVATTAETLLQAIGVWSDVAAPVVTLAWIGFAFALLVAFAGFYYELGEVVERFTLVDVGLSLVLVASLGTVRIISDWSVDTVAAVTTNAPAAAVYDEMGGDLMTALISIDKNIVGVHPASGGFGDVLKYKDGAWTRTQQWHGAGWHDDETPLDQVQQFSSLRPLLVIGGGEEAQGLPELLEKVGGSALLLLRAEEVKSDVVVPPELAYLQVTYLPLELATERDLKAEAWSAAGAKELNWGPTTWYGEGMDEEPIAYMAAMFEATGATGVQALAGERSRIKGVVSTCLPAIMQKAGEGKAQRNDKWCKLGAGEVEEVRKEAMEAWEAPVPERFRARFGKVSELAAAGIGEAFALDRITREFGAVDYCLGQAIDEGEELAGPMQLVLTFTRKGAVYADFHERSRNMNETAMRCVRDRLKGVQFEVDEEAWPEPQEPAEGEEPKPVEPQVVDLLLDIG